MEATIVELIIALIGLFIGLVIPLIFNTKEGVKRVARVLGTLICILAILLFGFNWGQRRGNSSTETIATPIITPPPGGISTPAGATPAGPTTSVIIRPALSQHEYFIQGDDIINYHTSDLLVVYAVDVGGLEFVAAIMYVLEENTDNRLARVIFERPDIEIASYAALRVNKEIDQVNMARLVPTSNKFIGFTLDNSQIRLALNSGLHTQDTIEAVQLTDDGSAIPFSPPILMDIQTLALDSNIAQVSLPANTTWPPQGTLLIVPINSTTHTIPVSDYEARSDICVRVGDEVHLDVTGTIIVGEFVGSVGPEGKDSFELIVSIPIDPKYDIEPDFPHGAVMFRVQGTDEWLSYDEIKQFTVETTGCLEFDINDLDNSDNSGEFSVTVTINP